MGPTYDQSNSQTHLHLWIDSLTLTQIDIDLTITHNWIEESLHKMHLQNF